MVLVLIFIVGLYKWPLSKMLPHQIICCFPPSILFICNFPDWATTITLQNLHKLHTVGMEKNTVVNLVTKYPIFFSYCILQKLLCSDSWYFCASAKTEDTIYSYSKWSDECVFHKHTLHLYVCVILIILGVGDNYWQKWQ